MKAEIRARRRAQPAVTEQLLTTATNAGGPGLLPAQITDLVTHDTQVGRR
ncbi:hypothetical protein [Mycobacterium sp.]|nr:hypothetical protein [Mycobacterium sp.]